MKARGFTTQRLTVVAPLVAAFLFSSCAAQQPSVTGESTPMDAPASSSLPAGDSPESTSPAPANNSRVLIDARRADEYAAGHLDSAINIDVTAEDFSQRIDALDKDATYVVYCRSGRRSAEAVARMKEAGFTHVSNAGGLDEAAQTLDVPIVTD